MKILHWDEMFHPSFGYQINLLAKFQAKQGHEIIIMTSDNIENHPVFCGFGNNENIKREDDMYSEKYGIKIVRLPIHRVVSGRVIYKRGYIRKIKELNPDVIMCHTNDTLSAIRIAQKYKSINIPIVFDNHMLEMASRNPLNWFFRLYFRSFVTPIIKKNKWTVIRTQDDNYVNKHLGIPENQTPFISFGTDTTLFHPDTNVRREFRKRYGIEQNDFVVVYTGKLNEGKGGKLLAQAFEKKNLISRDKIIVLIVVGNTSGEFGQEVENTFAKSENKIIRFPTQNYVDLPQFYQASDLSIFPKQCSLSFYDAQACGLPVLSENNNVNVSRCSHGNGMNFETDNVEDLRLKIIKCVSMDTDELKSMGVNALKFIQENYDYVKISMEYTRILENEFKKYNKKRQQ